MATYNGESYIRQQIDSIVCQLGRDDELVVVDDASTDQTVSMLADINDCRVRLFCNEFNVGHVKSFERAMRLANGDYIFLSDQDDLWLPGRLQIMRDMLRVPACLLVVSNFDLTDEGGLVRWKKRRNLAESDSHRKWWNLLRLFAGEMPYFGCAMAFRRDFRDLVCPFPSAVDAHDIWLAIMGNVCGGISHLEVATLLHRLHGDNRTPASRRGLLAIVASRARWIRLLLCAWMRCRAIK